MTVTVGVGLPHGEATVMTLIERRAMAKVSCMFVRLMVLGRVSEFM